MVWGAVRVVQVRVGAGIGEHHLPARRHEHAFNVRAAAQARPAGGHPGDGVRGGVELEDGRWAGEVDAVDRRGRDQELAVGLDGPRRVEGADQVAAGVAEIGPGRPGVRRRGVEGRVAARADEERAAVGQQSARAELRDDPVVAAVGVEPDRAETGVNPLVLGVRRAGNEPLPVLGVAALDVVLQDAPVGQLDPGLFGARVPVEDRRVGRPGVGGDVVEVGRRAVERAHEHVAVVKDGRARRRLAGSRGSSRCSSRCS